MAMTEAERKKRIKAGVKRWRHAMRASGRCTDCGKKAARNSQDEPYGRCRHHLTMAALNTARSHIRPKGLCWCGEKVGTGLRDQLLTQCKKHHSLARARDKRYRQKLTHE